MKPTTAYFLSALLLCVVPASAQDYYLLQSVADASGGRSSSPGYAMGNSAGGAGGGSGSSSGYSVDGGFWGQYDALTEFYSSSYALLDGWNLISVPTSVADPHKSALFPGSSSHAFAFEGSYVERDTLENGTGYWLKSTGNQFVELVGTPRPIDTITVVPGWNIIGSVSGSVATGSIEQIPPGIVTSQYFGYNGSYLTANTIEPGQGYWVKANAAGQLVLNVLPFSAPVTQPDQQTGELSELNVITVHPAAQSADGQGQQLLFGAAEQGGTTSDAYEMPPVPPGGGLDVRFGSNQFAEFFSGDKKEVPIQIRSNGLPLALSWTMNESAGSSYVLVEKRGGKVVAQHRLKTGGSIILKESETATYALRVEDIPMNFALEQNYPNPFNPTTLIRYQLPVNGHVTLTIYDVVGRKTATLIDGDQEAGFQSVMWDATDFATGVYFYRLTATSPSTGKSFSEGRRLMLVK